MVDSQGTSWRDSACDKCELRKSATQVVVATPCPEGGLLAVGEAPGEDEDFYGVGFIGDAGRKLHSLLKGQHLRCADYGVANVCRCRPLNKRGTGNGHPTPSQINSCVGYLASLVKEVRPKVVLAVGGFAAAVFCHSKERLGDLIELSRDEPKFDPSTAHKDIQLALKDVRPYIVPMPHTSPRLIGRSANGVPWEQVREEQVEYAVRLYRSCATHFRHKE